MADIYLELLRNGNYLKCTATCAETAMDAIAVGPINDPEGLKRLAVQKLKTKLAALKSEVRRGY
jgi:hypothetical protein